MEHGVIVILGKTKKAFLNMLIKSSIITEKTFCLIGLVKIIEQEELLQPSPLLPT